MIQNILLATDGSACAERAVDFAAFIARCSPSQVIVVHAFIPPLSKGEESLNGHPDFESKELAQQMVNTAVMRLKKLGIGEVTPVVKEGPAVKVILGAEDTFHPGLLIIGARGQGLWPGACLGSVCMAVTQRSNCPVLIIK